jgi:flagellar hook protein FlgE
LTKAIFDGDGKLEASYSNGQTVKGPQLALAYFDSNQDVEQLGGNEFGSSNTRAMHMGHANTQSFGSVGSGVLEGSNVDMAKAFGDLIVMQRGYQASSHVVSTANDMIQELFDMKGHR